MILWRISNYADLAGKGGLIVPGRWHRQGFAIVYCCDHPSTALLEILVHMDLDDLPLHFQLLKIQVPEDIALETVEIDAAEINDNDLTRQKGSNWLEDRSSCLLKVPSIILPEAGNVLINPQHADAARLVIENVARYPFDSRLFR
jgi:RES domain-containing protein